MDFRVSCAHLKSLPQNNHVCVDYRVELTIKMNFGFILVTHDSLINDMWSTVVLKSEVHQDFKFAGASR